jgi:dienelactone hydrolase
MFEYFPDNYPWSLSVVWAVEATGTFSEIHDAIEGLRSVAHEDARTSGSAWYSAWSGLAVQRLRTAQEAEVKGFDQTAGRSYFRAGIYQLMAIRFLQRDDPRGTPSYVKGAQHFLTGLRLLGKPGRAVDIPYRGAALPGILALPKSSRPSACTIIFGGFDSLKEWLYPVVVDPFLARGVGVLLVDQAGVGGALRLYNIPAAPESELSAAACVDFLESIPEVDSNRIGVAGISLGGYYAPRAAAIEKRIQACCAWGGAYDPAGLFARLISQPDKARSIPDMIQHAAWVFGTDGTEQTMQVLSRLQLAPVIERITCPLLVLHGENDQQVLDGDAENTVRYATNSRKAELKVFTKQEGGAEHCQLDNAALAGDYMADWFAQELGPSVDGAGHIRDAH